jgi:hypothetical protein
LNLFYNSIITEPFRHPVDWKALGLFDYPQLIKKPMDLGTVKRGILERKYKTLFDAAADVRLVWTNCMTYNADGSDFFILAQNLSKKWQDKWQKLINDLNLGDSAQDAATAATDDKSGAADGSSATPSGITPTSAPTAGGATSSGGSTKISFDDKRAFARALYKITKEDLGKLIVEVDTKCQQALTKNVAEDECELNVDKLSVPLFHELKEWVMTCVKENPANQASTSATNHTMANSVAGSAATSKAGGGGGSSVGSAPSSGSKKKVNPNKRQKTSTS